MLESEGRSSSYARLSVGGVLREGVVLEALAVFLERRDVPDAGAGLVRAPLLAAEESAPDTNSVRSLHGFLRASAEVQERFLSECCGEEGYLSAEHPNVVARRTVAECEHGADE